MADRIERKQHSPQPTESRQMHRSAQIQAYLKHTFRDSSRSVAFGVVIALGLALLLSVWTDFPDTWSEVLDPALTAMTTALAAAIWMGNRRRAWIEQLPRRISAHFTFWTTDDEGNDEEVYLMSCLESPLASESEERAWAQQLGQQMNDNKRLRFHPYFSRSTPQVWKDGQGPYLLHQFTYQLSQVPDYFTDHQEQAPASARSHRLNDESEVSIWYRVWFDNLPDTPRNKRLYTSELPTENPWTPSMAASQFDNEDSLHEADSEGMAST